MSNFVFKIKQFSMVEKEISMSQLSNFVFKIKRFSKVEKEISISQLV